MQSRGEKICPHTDPIVIKARHAPAHAYYFYSNLKYRGISKLFSLDIHRRERILARRIANRGDNPPSAPASGSAFDGSNRARLPQREAEIA